MLAEQNYEGRFVWKWGNQTTTYYYADKKGRIEAVKYVSSRTYDYVEEAAEEDPEDGQRLVYRRKK